MAGPDRTALVVATASATSARSNGATIRLAEVLAVLGRAGYRPILTDPAALSRAPAADLGVAVSYANAGALRGLQRRTGRTWLDAVDSWLLVNGSGMRLGHPSYAVRALRDGWNFLRMPVPDLVTYISGADLSYDRSSVRAARRLVLPGDVSPPRTSAPRPDFPRVVLAGDWGYGPNEDGLRWFGRSVLPELERRGTSRARVHVYGPGAVETAAPGCRFRGYVASDDELYARGDVHAAPLRFGGGVKRKVQQPLLAGLPVVTTSVGAHGLRSTALLDVCDDPRDFAHALHRRLSDEMPPPATLVLADRDETADVVDWLRR